MIRLLLFIFLAIMTPTLGAQSYTTYKTANKKLQKSYEKARDFSQSGQYNDALKILEKLLEEDPRFIDAHIRLAQIRYDQEALPAAEQSYEQALAIDQEYQRRLFYELALTELRQNKFEEAISHLEDFLAREQRNEQMINRAKTYLQNAHFAAEAVKNPVPFKPQKLEGLLNTDQNEFLPVLTADESMLVFSRLVGSQEDIFFSKKMDEGWGEGQPITALNTPYNEASQSISADGRTLVYTACERKDAIEGSCDLFIIEFRGEQWTQPVNMGPPVNTSAWESMPTLSANGRTLIFASKRNGGQGGEDLWITFRTPTGDWTSPKNLGDVINTPGDERAPFIHPDGRTLYFMSNGHPGMGQFDLFYTRLQADGNWSTPTNLGYPINTQADEGAIFVSLDGKTAFFNSNRIGQDQAAAANSDIYTFELYPEARPLPVTYVKANVKDQKTQENLSAKVTFTELESSYVFAQATTDQLGNFLVCLPAGKDYALDVSLDGYLFHSENFALSGLSTIEEPFLLEIELTPIPEATDIAETKSAPIVLNNVFFETGSATLKKASVTELTRLYQLLEDNSKLKIRINGHTDDVGNESDNLQLSEARAKAVYDFLIKKGVNEARLQYKGFGESQPIDSNEQEEGRKKNRRTEFEIIN